MYLPAQISPGLTKAVVSPLACPVSSVSPLNSTMGIRRLKGHGIPTSFTNDWRYGRLYITVVPHARLFWAPSVSPRLESRKLKPSEPVAATGLNQPAHSGRS